MYEAAMDKSANFTRFYQGGLIGNTNPLSTEVASSAPLCAVYCIIHARCVSFDFAPGNGQCHLHSLNPADIDVTPNDDFSVFAFLG